MASRFVLQRFDPDAPTLSRAVQHALRHCSAWRVAAAALLAIGAVVRVGEAIWGAGCTAYVLVRSLVGAMASLASVTERGAASSARVSAQRSTTQQTWVKNGHSGGSGN